jgi:cobalamin biosynthesis Co2+ chelatase CbiK
MELETYLDIKKKLIDLGYSEEIASVEHVLNNPCDNKDDFLTQYVWVICNSGMKYQIAVKIFEKVISALNENRDINNVFGHKGKCYAIISVWACLDHVWNEYQKAEDKIAYLKTLPWIGDITKYHLARNLGADCCKPDRHLVRIAKKYNTTPAELCAKLAAETYDKAGVVDVVLWRAGNLGII